MAAPILLTIGHSTLPWEDFLALLKTLGVKILADIRLTPFAVVDEKPDPPLLRYPAAAAQDSPQMRLW